MKFTETKEGKKLRARFMNALHYASCIYSIDLEPEEGLLISIKGFDCEGKTEFYKLVNGIVIAMSNHINL